MNWTLAKKNQKGTLCDKLTFELTTKHSNLLGKHCDK